MRSKKKSSTSKKDGALEASYDGKNWQTKRVTNEELRKLFSDIEEEAKRRVEQKYLPVGELCRDGVRIVVVVADTPQWWEPGEYVKKQKKLETGRAMAQACHAVSKLKLSYILGLSQGDPQAKCYGLALDVIDQPITTIVVKARDTEELLHISRLANSSELHSVLFQDENESFYKTKACPITAIAIGPYTADRFVGVTDYLPLWKSPDEL